MKINLDLTTLQFRSFITVVPTFIVTITHHRLGDAVSIGTCKLTGIACFDLILCTGKKGLLGEGANVYLAIHFFSQFTVLLDNCDKLCTLIQM